MRVWGVHMNTESVLLVLVSLLLLVSAGCVSADFSTGPQSVPDTASVAAAPAIAWEKTFDLHGSEHAQDVCEIYGGGFAVVGNTVARDDVSEITPTEICVIRTDARGQIVWSRTMNGTGFAEGNSIQATNDGGFIIAGQSRAAYNRDPSLILFTMNTQGDTGWERVYGRGHFTSGGNAAVQTHDGGYIACGWVKEGPGADHDLFLVRTDNSGEVIWQQQYGGSGYEEGTAVIETADRGFLVVGRTESSGAGDSDMYVVKTDASGRVIWEQTYGGVAYDAASDVKEISETGYIIAGQTTAPDGSGDPERIPNTTGVCLVRTDLQGNSIWEHSLGDTLCESCGHAVDLTPDGGFVVAGQRRSVRDDWEMYVLRTDGDGMPVWEYSWGGEAFDLAHSVVRTDDGGYIIAGGRTVQNETGAGMDIVMTRFVPDAVPVGPLLTQPIPKNTTPQMTRHHAWDPPETIREKTYIMGIRDRATDIVRTHDEGFVITGTTMMTNNSSVCAPSLSSDVFLFKTDSTGNLLWNRTFGGPSGDGAHVVRETADGGFIVAGYTTGPGDSDVDMYLVRTNVSGHILWEQQYGGRGRDVLYGVCETGDGGFMIAGETDLNMTYDVPSAYVAYTGPAGDILREHVYPGVVAGRACSLEPCGSDAYIIGAGPEPAGILVNETGRPVWEVNLSGVTISMFLPTGDGGFVGTGTGYLAGTDESALVIVRLNETGKPIWDISSPEVMSRGREVTETADGGFIAVGTCSGRDPFGAGNLSSPNAIYLMKTGPDGVLLWEKKLEPAAFCEGAGVLEVADGIYVVLGTIADEEFGQDSLSCQEDAAHRIYIAQLGGYTP